MKAAQSCPLCWTDELRAKQVSEHGHAGRMVWCAFCKAPLGVAPAPTVTPEPSWYRLVER